MSTQFLTRRTILGSFTALALAGPARADAAETLYVAKSPTCGCCGAWIDHMRSAGFKVEVTDLEYDALQRLKTRLGIAPEHASCHTARIGDYVVEGHVPASDIKRLIAERPDGLGLAVPGMPVGSPGMEMGSEREPYDTVLIRRDGTAEVFQPHR